MFMNYVNNRPKQSSYMTLYIAFIKWLEVCARGAQVEESLAVLLFSL